MNSIKLKRAAQKSKIGGYPRTWADVIAAIPADVRQALTSTQLAQLADSMHRQYEIGHSRGYQDAGHPAKLA